MNEVPSLIFFGLKHSGKSSIARSLAPFIHATAYDLDELCVQLMVSQYPDRFDINAPYQNIVRQFFKEDGREAFAQIEAKAVELWKAKSSFQKSILATGGGTMENFDAISQLDSDSLKIFIDVPEEILFNRIIRGGIPPFLDQNDPRESFHVLYEKRVEITKNIVDLRIAIQQETIEVVVAIVLKQVKEFIHAR